MTEIRALIADDEPLARRGVIQLLEAHGDVRVVGEARDGSEAVRLIRALQPDLLFLDVQMPDNDGFNVLARTAPADLPLVIFLTAYEEFAARAFDVDAVDYVVKPSSRQRFDRALGRARQRLQQLRTETTSVEVPVTVKVDTPNGATLIRPEEIDWIEAADYCAVVHARGARFVVRESLDALEKRMPPSLFLRTHRSALVNVARLRGFIAGLQSDSVVLYSGTEVPVSRRRKRAVLDRIRQIAG